MNWIQSGHWKVRFLFSICMLQTRLTKWTWPLISAVDYCYQFILGGGGGGGEVLQYTRYNIMFCFCCSLYCVSRFSDCFLIFVSIGLRQCCAYFVCVFFLFLGVKRSQSNENTSIQNIFIIIKYNINSCVGYLFDLSSSGFRWPREVKKLGVGYHSLP